MKKFTLLALAAMAFGSASADFVEKDIYGLKTSDPSEGAEKTRTYYKIQNMRAMRLDYANKHVFDAKGDTIGKDNAVIALDSVLYYFEGMEGYTEENAGKAVRNSQGVQLVTPKTSDLNDKGENEHAYMGLSALGGNWWLSFSAQPEIKDERTEYWWFEDASVEGDNTYDKSLWIHNAVMGGMVSGTSGHVKDLAGYNRANMDFKGTDDTNTTQKKAQHRYYLLPVKAAWEKAYAEGTISEDWVDIVLNGRSEENAEGEKVVTQGASLTQDQLDHAYAFCRTSEIKAGDQQCLDMNNYVNYKYRGVKRDEKGDTVFNKNEAGENTTPQYYGYGFAGVDRTWTPLTTTSNSNHWINNGTLFFFKEADQSKAIEAIEQYADQIAAEFKKGAVESAKGEMMNAAQIIKGWTKLPAVFGEESISELNALATYCENWNGEDADPDMVKDLDSRAAFIKQVKALADAKLSAGAALAGSGCKVKFMNMLRFDLHSNFNNGYIDEDYGVSDRGCLTAGKNVTYHENSAKPVAALRGHGITCEADLEDSEYKACEWELVNAGAGKFYLKSVHNGEYIMMHSMMLESIADGIDADLNTLNEDQISWATTDDITYAAPFSLLGCPTDEDPRGVSAEEESEYLMAIPGDYQFNLTNKVQLYCTYEKKTGPYTYDTKNEYIHVANANTDYRVCNFAPVPNSWLAGSNTFQIIPVEMGGISEVAAAEKPYNAGIYDLQGRKVAKASKGLYIINGVKTLVK
ncbi:MAG: hypothetical protein NC301_01305 [Bacteroides sp.]|nr:hypothetical protein [Bacteroides sp.]MCM1378751.1 hypothetical protein [Bacteroides sp.]MCM1445368.1 hypothetical protein [Prevotella sp.]